MLILPSHGEMRGGDRAELKTANAARPRTSLLPDLPHKAALKQRRITRAPDLSGTNNAVLQGGWYFLFFPLMLRKIIRWQAAFRPIGNRGSFSYTQVKGRPKACCGNPLALAAKECRKKRWLPVLSEARCYSKGQPMENICVSGGAG